MENSQKKQGENRKGNACSSEYCEGGVQFYRRLKIALKKIIYLQRGDPDPLHPRPLPQREHCSVSHICLFYFVDTGSLLSTFIYPCMTEIQSDKQHSSIIMITTQTAAVAAARPPAAQLSRNTALTWIYRVHVRCATSLPRAAPTRTGRY